jgi:hypothetical protein
VETCTLDEYVNKFFVYSRKAALGSVVGWGTTLQPGRWRFRFQTRSLDFPIWPNFSNRNMALRLTQPLVEMGTRIHPGGIDPPTSKANTAVCEPSVWKMSEFRLLTILWASKACYSDSFIAVFRRTKSPLTLVPRVLIWKRPLFFNCSQNDLLNFNYIFLIK